MAKVICFLAEGFEEIEALTVVDVLRRAGVNVITVSIGSGLMVEGVHAITVKADAVFDTALAEDADMLFLPGGMPGTTNLEKHTGLRQLLGEFAQKDKWLAAICAAPKIFGGLGLLKNKKATCFPGYESCLEGAEFLTDRVVIDGKTITSRGAGTAMEFSLKLVGILVGTDTAKELHDKMIVG